MKTPPEGGALEHRQMGSKHTRDQLVPRLTPKAVVDVVEAADNQVNASGECRHPRYRHDRQDTPRTSRGKPQKRKPAATRIPPIELAWAHCNPRTPLPDVLKARGPLSRID
jgi:hypothetical protein